LPLYFWTRRPIAVVPEIGRNQTGCPALSTISGPYCLVFGALPVMSKGASRMYPLAVCFAGVVIVTEGGTRSGRDTKGAPAARGTERRARPSVRADAREARSPDTAAAPDQTRNCLRVTPEWFAFEPRIGLPPNGGECRLEVGGRTGRSYRFDDAGHPRKATASARRAHRAEPRARAWVIARQIYEDTARELAARAA
jgi:hypothetical protein